MGIFITSFTNFTELQLRYNFFIFEILHSTLYVKEEL